MREKHKKIISDNDLLKERLRDRNEISIKDDSRQNAMMRELKSATEQSDRYLEEMGKLSKRVSLIRVRLIYSAERKIHSKTDLVKIYAFCRRLSANYFKICILSRIDCLRIVEYIPNILIFQYKI